MQKFAIFVALFMAAICVNSGSSAELHSRARRFISSTLDLVGGKIGCVVSQNKLFINGLFIKDLSEDEQQELTIYKDSQKAFKQQVHQYLEQRMNATTEEEVEQLKKPQPPKKPSFCTEKDTTQYVFDGCMIQGDNIYIGNNFVRKLSADEQQQLQEYDQQFTSYQEAISGQIRRQVEEAFGKAFGGLFTPLSSSSKSSNSSAASAEIAGGEGEGVLKKMPEQPKSPDFCTLII